MTDRIPLTEENRRWLSTAMWLSFGVTLVGAVLAALLIDRRAPAAATAAESPQIAEPVAA